MHHHNVFNEIQEAMRRGLREIIPNNAFFGTDRAPGREKKLLLEWKCCHHNGECAYPTDVWNENQIVPLPVY